MIRCASLLCASMALVLLAPAPLEATQIIYQSPEEMGKTSSLVVRGKVTSSRSYWNEKHTKILTETTIEIDETYKGEGPQSLKIVQLGGLVGKVRMHVHGALVWKEGEEVLLFLEPFDRDTYQVAGFSQGKFKIERDPETGEEFVVGGDLGGFGVLRAPGGEGAAPKALRVPLDQFVTEALGERR